MLVETGFLLEGDENALRLIVLLVVYLVGGIFPVSADQGLGRLEYLRLCRSARSSRFLSGLGSNAQTFHITKCKTKVGKRKPL